MDEAQNEPVAATEPVTTVEEPHEETIVTENVQDIGAEVQIDVLNCSAEEIVLPSTTSAGETVDVESVEHHSDSDAEIVYSSLPPDLNIEVMNRATRTPHIGVKFSVKKIEEDRLRVFVAEDSSVVLPFFDRVHICIACNRRIEKNELYLNFPDDLDRRRLWGSALGFKYSEMLRLKINTGYSLTSIGYICTDHFSEECFRKYNFNKAAIEAFGMPLMYSSHNPPTPSKRTPWDCTVCNFRCFSVFEMYNHLSNHAKKGREDSDVLHALNNKGVTCPFCRKCTYGYKTIGGFRRHLETEPKTHFYLKRIFEVAAKNCRSSCLDPSFDWSRWTERNVYFAYHGCELPQKSPMKRANGSDESPSPAKRPQKSSDEDDERTPVAARRLDLSPEAEPSTSVVTMRNNASKPGPAATIEISSHMLSRVKALIPEAIISTDNRDEFVVESTSTLADALDYVAEEDRTEEGLQLITDSPIQPKYPFEVALTQNDQRHMAAKQRKTQRQLESSEARLRLFGDETYVEVPRGYKKVETSDGPRLVHVSSTKSWEERFAPAVRIDNRRFQPLN